MSLATVLALSGCSKQEAEPAGRFKYDANGNGVKGIAADRLIVPPAPRATIT